MQIYEHRCVVPIAVFALILLAMPALAVPPVVKTVPWVATNPLIPHDTWSGKSITLKGTSDIQGANIQYTWDFGDGSPVATGVVSDMYAIEARHTYSGSPGQIFTARLTVQNMTTGESANKEYYVEIRDQTLGVEVNVAIDEGLWYLHKAMTRSTSGGIDYGDWSSSKYGGYANLSYYAVSAANVNAFEVNGHLETGSSSNPYTETVARGLRRLFSWLTTRALANQTNGLGTFNPDSNGNGYGAFVNQSYEQYQGGSFMDAIIATNTPNAITTTGPAPSGANPGILGRTYASIVQDMVDDYSYCQYDPSPGGGWRYSCNQWPDNSACQWAAIGMIPAGRIWGAIVPQIVKDWNWVWLQYSQGDVNSPSGLGRFGYDQPYYYPWNTYALTPSGMVQMAMVGVGRGNARWDKAETFMRDNFGNTGGAYYAVRDYYYGLFSFVKSLLLHDSDADGTPEPITLLQSQTPGVSPIDWYAAQAANGDPTDGVARTLVNDQSSYSSGGGYWYGHNYEGNQYRFETAWAIIMLNRTIFEAGAPVAVATATPNPTVVGATITLDGSGSFHQDSSKTIDSWEWDFNNDGTFDASGPQVTTSFAALGTYPVKLRVTDNGVPEKSADTIVNVLISFPPIAPTANAGGPYNFCANRTPWFLDGSGSVNPDEGQSLPGSPGDTIQEYSWDLPPTGSFGDAFGVQPDVTGAFTALGPGSYLVQLRVTDTTATSFPGPGITDLSDTDSAQVFVRSATDPICAGCISNLAARPKLTKVQLTWTPTGAHHYNVYRGTVNGGPYVLIATTASTYSTYLDSSVVVGTTYYYVVRPAEANGNEICQSNQASATPRTR